PVFLFVEHLSRRRELDPRRRLAHLLVKDFETSGDRDLQQVALGFEAEPMRDVLGQPDEAARHDTGRFVAAGASDLALEQIPALVLFMVDMERRLTGRRLEVEEAKGAAGLVAAGL